MSTVVDVNHLVDISNVERRLQKKLNMDESSMNNLSLEYKKFLYLAKLHPKVYLVPGPLVDEVWHDHILHTEQYMEDCQNLFGKYMHHAPSTTEGPEDISETFHLYSSTFGMEPPTDIWSCAGSKCTNCCGNTCGRTCSNCTVK